MVHSGDGTGIGDVRDRNPSETWWQKKKRPWVRVWTPTCVTCVRPDGSVRYSYGGRLFVEVPPRQVFELAVTSRKLRWFRNMASR